MCAKKRDSSAGSGGGPPSFPPGTDVEALHRSVVQYLQKGAYISAVSTPVPFRPSVPITAPKDPKGIVGIDDYAEMHRFSIHTVVSESGVSAADTACRIHFNLSERVAFCPDDYSVAPGKKVPPTPLDPTKSQSLAQLDVVFAFGGEDRLEGFGAGKTFPVEVDGDRHLRVGVAGAITGGSGIFKDAVGSYVVNGYLRTPEDHCLQVLIRLQDDSGKFRTQEDLKEFSAITDPDPNATYMTLVGEEDPENPPQQVFKDGKLIGGHIVELLRLVWLDFDDGGDGRLRTNTTLGRVVAKLETNTRFNPKAAPGTPEAPFPFITQDTTITFFDPDGNTLGTLGSNIDLGRGYWMPAPELSLPVPPCKIVGFGAIEGGTGQFEGAKGLFSVNSVITLAPAALFNMYVFRFEDPDHKFGLGEEPDEKRPDEKRPEASAHGGGTMAKETQTEKTQKALNRAAIFNTLTLPDLGKLSTPIVMPKRPSALAGLEFHGLGHRFNIVNELPSQKKGLRAKNVVGEEAIDVNCRWLFMPHGFEPKPDNKPEPTAFDPSQPQLFGLWDCVFDFGGGNTVKGFGDGQTFPSTDGSDRVRIAANGAVLGATGQFEGLTGNFTFMGFFTPPAEFSINVLIRIVNPSGSLLTDSLPPIKPISYADYDTTYLSVRCTNQPQLVQVNFSPEGIPNGLVNLQNMNHFHSDFTVDDNGAGPRCQRSIGDPVGYHTVRLSGDLGPSPAHPGTPTAPIPFSDQEGFLFYDSEGVGVGHLGAGVIEGRTIFTLVDGVPQQAGSTIASGYAEVEYGTGIFAGSEGLVANVATGTVNPNQIDLVYVMALHDPDGKFRV